MIESQQKTQTNVHDGTAVASSGASADAAYYDDAALAPQSAVIPIGALGELLTENSGNPARAAVIESLVDNINRGELLTDNSIIDEVNRLQSAAKAPWTSLSYIEHLNLVIDAASDLAKAVDCGIDVDTLEAARIEIGRRAINSCVYSGDAERARGNRPRAVAEYEDALSAAMLLHRTPHPDLIAINQRIAHTSPNELRVHTAGEAASIAARDLGRAVESEREETAGILTLTQSTISKIQSLLGGLGLSIAS